VPLDAPARFTKVKVAQRFIGGDGLLLLGTKAMLLVANQVPTFSANAAFSLWSEDGWASASLRATQKLGNVYPTTAVLRRDWLYVVHSNLNSLIQSPPEQKMLLEAKATISAIAKVEH
jgi:hypothetical protein